ncbi:MAG: hypothetical protein GX481_03100 [Atopobium sp.]|nr:helix-hairpin-helix domain-containing protein [Atopobiaceae bacterium]NLH91441.1 hypothetical protein [Atopobium sp.]
MAQRRSGLPGSSHRLLRRLGLRTKHRLLIACGVVMAAVAVASSLWALSPSGFVIERDASGSVADAAAEASPQAASSAQRAQGADGGSGSQARDVPTIVVDVEGAVALPGVYELSIEQPRVRDAVSMANGLTAEADTSSLNLAELLSDGQKIYVPHQGEVLQAAPADSAVSSSASSGSSKVNINTAGSADLQTLSGVGEATAKAIIEDREQNGSFASIEDIMRVTGIGEKKFEKIKGDICV